MKPRYILLFTLSLAILSKCNTPNNSTLTSKLKYDQNRLAAEWEPAIGVMITWPLHVPHKLVIELAKDSKLFTLVPNETSSKEAISWFKKWNINLSNVQFIQVAQDVDASWVRDWGPHAVFNPTEEMKLGDGQYLYSTPLSGFGCDDELRFIFTNDNGDIIKTKTEDDAPIQIAEQLNIEVLELPFVFTGGNVLTDGRGSVFSTCIIANENEYDGLSETDFFEKAEELVGAHQYNIISNFEAQGIQHIDCFMKILDEETLLVAKPPLDHELFPVYENIVENELTKLKSVFGRSYKILRLDTDRYEGEELAAYTNSLILNKNIYVPLFDIPQDSIALNQWEEYMPGYTVKGFPFRMEEEPILADLAYELYDEIGWRGGDALHCRTRAIWDPDMLYLSVKPLPKNISFTESLTVEALIQDYSQQGLKPNSISVYWRAEGQPEWVNLPMSTQSDSLIFSAKIPIDSKAIGLEYYVSAESLSGNKEAKPMTAPQGYYYTKNQLTN